MTTPGARPPVFLWFVRRTMGWTILVWGCALPLLMATWARAEPDGRIGTICGVAVWTVALVACAERLRSHGLDRASRILRSGTAVFLVVQGLAAAVLPPLAFLLFYAPAVWVASSLPLIPSDASSFRGDFVLTTMCGGQALLCALALGHLVEKLRPQVERMLGRAPRRPGW